MPTDAHGTESPKFLAATKLIGRTGAESFQVGFQDELTPTAWMAIATYDAARHAIGAGFTPEAAVLQLCEKVIDGGECKHCHRPSAFDGSADSMPLDGLVCWYQWDPELETFRRGCEGS